MPRKQREPRQQELLQLATLATYDRVLGYLVRLTGDHHLAQDLNQKTYEVLCDQVDNLQKLTDDHQFLISVAVQPANNPANADKPAYRSLLAWLLGVAHNMYLRDLQTKGRHPMHYGDLPDTQATVASHEEQISLHDAFTKLLSHLMLEERQLLILVYYEGLPYAELSQVFGFSEGTLRTRVHRLRLHLLELINTKYPELLPLQNQFQNN